jgi:hypothetical protein
MNRQLVLVVAVLLIMGSFGWAYTVDEVRELRNLGFTPEQIVEMAKTRTATPAATVDSPANGLATTVSPSPEQIRMETLRAANSGLLVICCTKEWPDRGPGFLHADLAIPGGAWRPIGQVPVLDYTTDGRQTPPKFEYKRTETHVPPPKKDGKGQGDGDDKKGKKDRPGKTEVSEVTIMHVRDIITSRYYAEIEVAAGLYDVRFERVFKVGEQESNSLVKQKKSKIIRGITVAPGKVTVVSHFWKDNDGFGRDHAMPVSHLGFAQQCADPFAPWLQEVRHGQPR